MMGVAMAAGVHFGGRSEKGAGDTVFLVYSPRPGAPS